jgi:TP53 regulating kinase-like protein
MDTIDKVPLAKLFAKGAEASLFIVKWQGRKAVIKIRIPKRYRPNELDAQIRNYRTTHEPQLMNEAKAAGVVTPMIYLVNVPQSAIIMEYVEGKRVKELLNGEKDSRHGVCFKIGESVASLHFNGLIHGDLTTSNMIWVQCDRICFIDFGLSERSMEIEAQGVDLHLLKRAMQSTHFGFWEECFHAVQAGYTAVLGEENAEKVYQKIREIERRGRYVEERKQ